jgi:diacylglycerol kinase family enzyme
VAAADYLDEQFDLDELVVEADEPFPSQVDGDYLGDTTRLEFRHVGDAVQLVFPVRSTSSTGRS